MTATVRDVILGLLGVLAALGFFGALLAAWITHLMICFQDNRWGFLIAGAIFFPIAIVHGAGHWFGFW